MTRTVDPTGADLKRLVASVPADTPVTMVNLLRFRAQATYPAGSGHAPCSGRDAYQRYGVQVMPILKEIGAQPLFVAPAIARIIGPDGEDWHEVLIVRYPSLKAFLAMVARPDYQAITVHRSAALEDARLIATRTPEALA
ncbi:MAG TPA: DUF1330 domain-containing protein [Candidatus Binatia bacterium]|nr:DUF1330 domain-containing protein [Candidatus Binatia bacterium]